MRKIIASLALSALALVPATSAWAGPADDGAPAPEVTSSTTEAAPTDGSAEKEIFAVGCANGLYTIWLVGTRGGISSISFPLMSCPIDSIYLI